METTYHKWQKEEGIPIIGGFSVENIRKVSLGPWKRKGGRGCFVNLEGTELINDCYICEIEPGGSLKPQKHLFEEIIYVVSGRGATTIWNEGGKKQTFEWQAGSLFSPPMNTWHQHFNGSGDQPARYLAVTSATVMLNLFHNPDFVFQNDHVFKDRFSSQDDYFSSKGKFIGTRIWESNFIPDVKSIKLIQWKERGAGGSNINFVMSENAMAAHISEFPVGTYKKAHRHGPGAHVIILNGTGYSLLWPEHKAQRIKVDWHEGSMVVPPSRWFHQHFNTGPEPARYLALRWGSAKWGGIGGAFKVDESVKEGGDQIEYPDEDPAIRKLYKEDLKKYGGAWKMTEFFPGE